MKKYAAYGILLILCTVFFSFSSHRGGDVFEVYLNGKQVLQQFVHIDKSVKKLSLNATSENDRIEVLYSHCGVMGKNRVLSFRNEKNELVKELKFPDATSNRSLMRFTRKELSKSKNASLQVYYSSKELPQGLLLTSIHWNENKVLAKL